jgi:FHA domain/TIR domain
MASAMRIRLKGRELAFPARREIILGRDPMVDVRSDNPLVSRHHARLRPQQLGWVLEDTKSKHGTFVDGKPITSLAVTGPMTVWLAEPNAGEVVLLLPEGTPSGLFISYRREDASGESGRLYDHLIAHFGEQMVFRDIDTITPGSDFVSRIEDAVGACQVVLVIIGRSWLTITGPDGQRRLDNRTDFVRLELTSSLQQGIRIIPVLVQDAEMPRPQDLPEPLQELSRRNAIELSDDRWGYDVRRLVAAIEKSVRPQRSRPTRDNPPPRQTTTPPPPAPRPSSWARWLLRIRAGGRRVLRLLIGGLLIGTVLIVIIAKSG